MAEEDVVDVQEQRKSNVGGITGKGFMPGQSGNPGGRKPGVNITRHIREALERADEERARALADQIIQLASEGNGVALKQVLDRIDGPVVEKQEIKHELNLTDEERAARVAALLDAGRARRTGSTPDDGE